MALARRHFGWSGDLASVAALPREAFDYHGTPGDDHLKTSKDADAIDMSQGGDDFVNANVGDDTIYFGAAFTGADQVNGGKGFDTVTLDGDYSAGVEVQADSFFKVEKLVLEGGSYVITGELNFNSGLGITNLVDARALPASQSLNLDVSIHGGLTVIAGAGDDVLRVSQTDQLCQLFGGDGDDTLIGGGGPLKMGGGAGADRIVMGDPGDVAIYGALDSSAKVYDTIENFAASGGRIELVFDSDTSTPDFDLDFHFDKTADRTGNILFKYDAGLDETIVKVFTDADHKADFVLHLTGNVPLTPTDFIFG